MANHYIDNGRFEILIKEYSTDIRDNENELMEMFDLLITNILMGFRFDVEFDDAKQECFWLILRVLKNFDRESGSAFNYFTTVIANNCRLIYSKDKKYADKISRYTQHVLGYKPNDS